MRIRKSRRVPEFPSARRVRRTGMRWRAAAEKRLPEPAPGLAERIKDAVLGRG